MDKRDDFVFGPLESVSLSESERLDLRERVLRFSGENPVRAEALERHTQGMMLRTPQDVFDRAESVALSPQEHADIRASLRSFAADNPVHAPEGFFVRLLLPLRSLPTLALIATVLAGSGGAVAYAAESAVPGDYLYTLKVDVLEPLRGRFNLTPEAQARWSARRIERRLQEAEVLVLRAGLSDDHRRNLLQRMQRDVDRLGERAHFMSQSSESAAVTEVYALVESSIEAHEELLSALLSGTASGTEIDTLLTEIRDVKIRAVADRHSMESTLASATGSVAMRGAETVIENASLSLRSVQAAMSDTQLPQRASLEERVGRAAALLVEARRFFEEDRQSEAVTAATQALRLSHQLQLVIDANARRTTIDDPVDVPVIETMSSDSSSLSSASSSSIDAVETPEEQEARVMRDAAGDSIIAVRGALSTQRQMVVEQQVEDAEKLMQEGEVALNKNAFDEARDLFLRARNRADEAAALLRALQAEIPSSSVPAVESGSAVSVGVEAEVKETRE